MSPLSAIQKLKMGNESFSSGHSPSGNLACPDKRMKLATEGQKPFAVVVTCADSRVPAEAIFQTDLGDLFVIRVAGCCVDSSVVASVEYAISEFDCGLCIVMGHSKCGAIKAAMHSHQTNTKVGTRNIEKMLAPIMPLVSLESAKETKTFDGSCDLVERLVDRSTVHQIGRLKKKSSLISKRVSNGNLQLLPARYCIETGKVNFELENKI